MYKSEADKKSLTGAFSDADRSRKGFGEREAEKRQREVQRQMDIQRSLSDVPRSTRQSRSFR